MFWVRGKESFDEDTTIERPQSRDNSRLTFHLLYRVLPHFFLLLTSNPHCYSTAHSVHVQRHGRHRGPHSGGSVASPIAHQRELIVTAISLSQYLQLAPPTLVDLRPTLHSPLPYGGNMDSPLISPSSTPSNPTSSSSGAASPAVRSPTVCPRADARSCYWSATCPSRIASSANSCSPGESPRSRSWASGGVWKGSTRLP
jgi:hypothetical protein